MGSFCVKNLKKKSISDGVPPPNPPGKAYNASRFPICTNGREKRQDKINQRIGIGENEREL